MYFINSNDFIYSHREVSTRNSTLSKASSLRPRVTGIGSSLSCPARLDLRLKLEFWPITMAIVLGCSKLCLASFHLGHTPYRGSKTEICWTPFGGPTFRPCRGTHDQGGWVISLSDGLGSVARSHGIELRFDTELGDEYYYYDSTNKSDNIESPIGLNYIPYTAPTTQNPAAAHFI